MIQLKEIDSPIVYRKCLLNWKTFQRLSPEYIAQTMEHNEVKFRLGKKNVNRGSIIKYGDIVINETFQNFLEWCRNIGKGKFSEFDVKNDWAYCSYECVSEIFAAFPTLINEIDWTYFGLEDNLSFKSVFWLGSMDSFTDCHYDTYGRNLVCQMRGFKRWILFPPSDVANLYPTRLPYEESSVYSAVDFTQPDLRKYSRLEHTRPMEVTIGPGDALLVPRHWWHFVRTVKGDDSSSCSMSLNLWLDDPAVDDDNRVREALSKAVTYSFLDSSFLSPLPGGCVTDKEDFLSGCWGEDVVASLNELMTKDERLVAASRPNLLADFEGQSLVAMCGADYFGTRLGDEGRSKEVSAFDVLNAFTNPEVIELVRQVLLRRLEG